MQDLAVDEGMRGGHGNAVFRWGSRHRVEREIRERQQLEEKETPEGAERRKEKKTVGSGEASLYADSRSWSFLLTDKYT